MNIFILVYMFYIYWCIFRFYVLAFLVCVFYLFTVIYCFILFIYELLYLFGLIYLIYLFWSLSVVLLFCLFFWWSIRCQKGESQGNGHIPPKFKRKAIWKYDQIISLYGSLKNENHMDWFAQMFLLQDKTLQWGDEESHTDHGWAGRPA